jgi:hypothetical protein
MYIDSHTAGHTLVSDTRKHIPLTDNNYFIQCLAREYFFIHISFFQIGFVFVFNLIVGTGALTLPSAFARTGWVLGTFLIIILAFMSYVTVTFVIEVSFPLQSLWNNKKKSY